MEKEISMVYMKSNIIQLYPFKIIVIVHGIIFKDSFFV
jgi:hypothetical protein